MYVCGVDHLLKGVSFSALEDFGGGAIVVGRKTYSQLTAIDLAKKYQRSGKPFVHLINEEALEDVSSTQIRERLKSGTSLQNLLHPRVEAYLHANKLA